MRSAAINLRLEFLLFLLLSLPFDLPPYGITRCRFLSHCGESESTRIKEATMGCERGLYLLEWICQQHPYPALASRHAPSAPQLWRPPARRDHRLDLFLWCFWLLFNIYFSWFRIDYYAPLDLPLFMIRSWWSCIHLGLICLFLTRCAWWLIKVPRVSLWIIDI